MHTLGALRHQTIQSLMSQHSEGNLDTWVALWDPLAHRIILIVGEAGFESLYARSVFLTQGKFPWLSADRPMAPADPRLSALKTGLQTQPSALTAEANGLLLITFTDILATLIGEPLMASILDSAWGSRKQLSAGEAQHDGS
jgi:hypothetical protein